jgi:hypothetical protein
MEKLVRRVTVVQGSGSGEHRDAKVVYESDEDDDDFDQPSFKWLERNVRHILKAQVTAAQEAYQRHLDSAAKGGSSWLMDEPGNFMKARRKAMKEMRKAVKDDEED